MSLEKRQRLKLPRPEGTEEKFGKGFKISEQFFQCYKSKKKLQ